LAIKIKSIVNSKGCIMKNSLLVFVSASAILCCSCVLASDAAIAGSKPIGVAPSLSKEEVQKGIERGAFCTDAQGLACSRGAAIDYQGKFYRCVKAYGENFSKNQKLVWVELTMRNGEAVTAD
jgi:hypothetical protein